MSRSSHLINIVKADIHYNPFNLKSMGLDFRTLISGVILWTKNEESDDSFAAFSQHSGACI